MYAVGDESALEINVMIMMILIVIRIKIIDDSRHDPLRCVATIVSSKTENILCSKWIQDSGLDNRSDGDIMVPDYNSRNESC